MVTKKIISGLLLSISFLGGSFAKSSAELKNGEQIIEVTNHGNGVYQVDENNQFPENDYRRYEVVKPADFDSMREFEKMKRGHQYNCKAYIFKSHTVETGTSDYDQQRRREYLAYKVKKCEDQGRFTKTNLDNYIDIHQ